ncbi:MAG: hypothetical protein GY754_16315, partial [bacterium]|nr:hypothetical protein [bacterium]
MQRLYWLVSGQGYGDSGKECDPLWDREKIRKKLIRKRIGNKKRLVAGTL